jgi:hypothetical protein
MKLLDLALLGGIAFLGYRIFQEQPAPVPVQTPPDLSGNLSQSNVLSVGVYPLASVYFESLNYNTQNALLRGFAEDYVAPRMLKSDKDYEKALYAANNAGAPVAWTQIIMSKNPSFGKEDAYNAAVCSLSVCDKYLSSGGKDLYEMRNMALRG